jgi:hypothetical protein
VSAERIAKLKARLEAIDDAREAFALGKRTFKGSYSGHSFEFAQADMHALDRLEASAKFELARLEGTRTGYGRMRITF